MPESDTSELLAMLESLVTKKRPRVAMSLNQGSGNEGLECLAPLFGGGLPPELQSWFGWHDGQKEETTEAMIPDTNWTALSCARVVEAHQWLSSADPEEVMKPWKPSWIPLYTNGSGDYLCLDREDGSMVTWYHDDRLRPRPWQSFTALLEAVVEAYERLPGAPAIPVPGVEHWTRVEGTPSPSEMASYPAGTAFTCVADYPTGETRLLHVKIGDDRWLSCFGSDLPAILRKWEEFAANPPDASSGYYKDDVAVLSEWEWSDDTLERGS